MGLEKLSSSQPSPPTCAMLPGADGLTTTVTNPAGATFITVRNTDGSLAHESGSGQRELWHAYDIQNYRLRETVKLADNRTTLSQTLISGLGQVVTQTTATTTGFFYDRSEYSAKGQLVKQYRDTGSRTTPTAPTLYEYDAFGNVTKQTLALVSTPTAVNSPIVKRAYTVESTPEGVYQVTTQTRYNAAGESLTTIQKQLISQSCPHLEAKTVSINERGLTSSKWTEYTDSAKRIAKSRIPTSDIVAESVTVDGFTLRQTDHTGVAQRFNRAYRSDGMLLKATDGRGNTTATQTDLLGRTVSVTDATGATTTTSYDPASGQPAVITDAMGHTSCYRYDQRGRKIAEWGTGIQPACFEYDEADRMTALTTFRADAETISIDPSNRTDGDTTRWAYHDATGLETRKTYADGSSITKSYDAYNRLSEETLARGLTKTHRYEHNRGLLLGTAYSDGTAARAYQYNHLGQLVQVTDDAGTRTIGYNGYGEQETDSLATAEGVVHFITEMRDTYGRSTGYTYAKNGSIQQTVTTGYSPAGRIASAGFEHNGEEQRFTYSYLPGSGLLQQLAMPNGVTLTQAYEPRRDCLTEMSYRQNGATLAARSYRYDSLGRPIARDIHRNGTARQDRFGYNARSELTDAQLGMDAYRYDYDNIGNRTATRGETETAYTANALNQYTRIGSADGAACFAPAYDADGNQTLVKTSTGVWHVEYNAENRPVTFTRTEGNVTTRVSCTYDSMGRRATKKVETNGETTLHQRYLYRGYLQLTACDLTTEGTPNLWHILWDPNQPIATRPLAIQKDGTWYTYGWDLTKNVCEVFNNEGTVATAYNYTPYGEVTVDGDATQPVQWSSEFNDAELGLVYYNYRHYNPNDGRWCGRDMINDTFSLYCALLNHPIMHVDELGNAIVILVGGVDARSKDKRDHDRNVHHFRMAAAMKIKEIKRTNPDEVIEVIMETETYEIRKDEPSRFILWDYNAWHKKRDYYSSVFYNTANVYVRCINTKNGNKNNNLENLISTSHDGEPRSGTSSISALYYYGHGKVGSLGPQFAFENAPVVWMISLNDMKNIFKKEYFANRPYIELMTCHSASTSKKSHIQTSLAQALSKHINGIVFGLDGRADYAPLGSNPPAPPKAGTSISTEADSYGNTTVEKKTFDNGVLIK